VRADLFIADGIDVLASGKLAVLGLFADRVIVLKRPSDLPADESLSFNLDAVVCITGLPPGEHSFAIAIERAAEGAEAEPKLVQVQSSTMQLKAGESTNVVMRFRPFMVRAAGTRTFVLTVGEEVRRMPFEIRIEPGIAAQAPGSPVGPDSAPTPA
jgi:hypothetical protein